MKLCDLTQFYSPLSGGVKRYILEKIRFIESARPGDEHVLIIPGEKNELAERAQSRIYTIRSPLISRSTRYRALLDLRALHEIIERERPDIIESSDPYQVGWEAIRIARAQRIPVVAFYHSHFPEAYLRRPAQRLGRSVSAALMRAAQAYACKLYNRYDATLVASPRLAEVLTSWGVKNTRPMTLGVDIGTFHPSANASNVREKLRIPRNRTLLLYVGRLSKEKNTQMLFEAFTLLASRPGTNFHLLVIGDGQQRELLRNLAPSADRVTGLRYCTDSAELAQYYGAADLFVHPGVEETFGLVALESQACGTPVVGIGGTYMDDVIQHDQDSWAQKNSAAALAGAIQATSSRDLQRMGAAAATAVAARYAWPRVFSELFCVYQEVANRMALPDEERPGIRHP